MCVYKLTLSTSTEQLVDNVVEIFFKISQVNKKENNF